MMKVICEDFTNTLIGPQCQQCHKTYVWASGAVMHQERIDENNGICPDAPSKEEEPES